MRKNILLTLSAALLLFTLSCNKAGKTGLLVPKDAAIVLHINMASLSSKLSWEEIKQTNWFKELQQQSPDSLAKQLLDDPEKSGIDTKSDQALFLKTEGRGGYLALVGQLKDPVAYEAMINSIGEGKIKISKDGGLSIAESGPSSLVVWNKSSYIVIGNAALGEMLPPVTGGEFRNNRAAIISRDSLALLAKQILTLEGGQLLDSDKRFADLVAEKGDIHVWMNSERLYGGYLGGMLAMMKVNLLIQNNVAAVTVNFDNGKIVASAKQYYGKEVTDLLKKYEPKNVSTSVINRLPAGPVLLAGAFNYPPEGLQAMLTLIGVNGMINGFLGEMNYSMEEFIKANKGDIAFAINDFKLDKDSVAYEGLDGKKEYYTREKPDLKFIAGVAVNDKEAFNKLIGLLSKQLEKFDPANSGVSYKLQDDWFVAGSSEQDIAAFLAGNTKPSYADKISGHAGGAYVDLQGLLKMGKAATAGKMMNDDHRDIANKSIDISLNFWQDVVFYGDIKNGVTSSQIEVNLLDKNTNSLKQLNKYVDQLAALHPLKGKEFHEDPDFTDPGIRIDTTRKVN